MGCGGYVVFGVKHVVPSACPRTVGPGMVGLKTVGPGTVGPGTVGVKHVVSSAVFCTIFLHFCWLAALAQSMWRRRLLALQKHIQHSVTFAATLGHGEGSGLPCQALE